MSQGPLCPNLSQKVQKEVSQMANRNLSCAMLYRWFKCKLKPPKNDYILRDCVELFKCIAGSIVGFVFAIHTLLVLSTYGVPWACAVKNLDW